MCLPGMNKPSAPSVAPTPLPPVVLAPVDADTSAIGASTEEMKRRRAATGKGDTVLTGGLGVTGAAQTGGKKLLGE